MLELLPILSMILVMGGTMLMAKKDPLTWVLFTLANLSWISYGIFSHVVGPVIYGNVLNLLNCYGAYKWTVEKRCKNLGIKKPGRGYWAKHADVV